MKIKLLSKDAKPRMYEGIVVLTLLYGCEV
jgi:hypothetical protein